MKRYDCSIKNEAPAIWKKPPKQYPWLGEDKHGDICVIGGGLTGAMCALKAAEMGLSVVLITSQGIGYGDTGHVTGCARFDSGWTLSELDRLMTTDDALQLYSMGFEALDGLQNLCGRLDGEYKKSGISSGFSRRDLLLFTSDPTNLELMEREYIPIRKKIPQCSLITRKTAESSFEFPISCGILTSEGSAVLNPYALAHLCLLRAEELGAEIFEQTEAIDIQTPKTEEGCVIIKTSTHRTIYADRGILAAGSEGTHILPGRLNNHTLFSVIGFIPEYGTGWSGKCTLGTYGKHSQNCTISSDGQLAASCVCKSGRLRSLFRSADETANYEGLCNLIRNVLPKTSEAKIKFKYCYDFVSSHDGLPIIGKHDAYKNCIFAIPGLYRESGMPIFSHIAAKITSNILETNTSENLSAFSPMR